MRIAVVGAGFAGLSVSYFLSDFATVTVFDAGGGASGVSTGLLHPFIGRSALRSSMAEEGMAATWELIQVAEKTLGRPVAERTGILRLAIDERQKRDFRKRAEEDPEAIWWNESQVAEKVPGATFAPGIWIPGGGTVYSKLYLDGLYRACLEKGVIWEGARVESLAALAEYDQVILATGYETVRFPECANLPLEPTKGHTLLCRFPEERLPFSLVSMGHISPTEDPSLCQIGSTYEHNFRTTQPDPKAIAELKAKAALFYPAAADFELVELRAGIRTSRVKAYKPVVEKVAEKVWVFTGLGSRGLLYHALYGKKLAEIVGRSGILFEL